MTAAASTGCARVAAAVALALRLEGETLNLLDAGRTAPARAFVRAGGGACP